MPPDESYVLVDTTTPELWVRKPLEVGAVRMARRASGLETGNRRVRVTDLRPEAGSLNQAPSIRRYLEAVADATGSQHCPHTPGSPTGVECDNQGIGQIANMNLEAGGISEKSALAPGQGKKSR